ncbi:hypothetical protein [Asinibacterium sp. OR53]|uniref:hypothetical protein n=1 Tax=Asinibacterium sp. OR53 TaxID=925409 RepID=UPI0004BC1A53|nr:hypothetical protein [Asinibacterium sp. OR53]
MKQILLSLLTVLIFSGTLLAQTSQTKTKANAGRQPENGSESRSNETDEHGHHRFYKDTLLAKAGIFYDSLSLKGYRVLTTAQLQGNANYLAKFSANQTLVNSLVQDNGTRLLVNGAMSIRDSANINGLLTVGALTSLGNGLNVNGAANFNGITNLNNAVIIKGPVTANAFTSLGAGLNVKGTANFSDSVNVNGITNLNNAVIVKGPLTANALTSLGAGLNVKGTTNLNDSLNINGPININTLMSLGSGLNVNGATNLNGAVIAQGPLTSNALTSLTAGLNVKGTTNFNDSVNVNGPININTVMSLGSGLNVNGPVVLKNGLTLQALPAGQTTDSLLTIGVDGTVKRKDASLLFNPHPSFSDLTLTGPLTGTTAQFSNGLSLGSANSGVYQWKIAGSSPYLALSTAANANAFTLQPNGNIGIGTAAPGDYQLAVEGTIGARKLKVVATSPWADYVFDPAYRLRPLQEVEQFIYTYKHLPEVPTADNVKQEGVDVGETQTVLLKKIEELTLYLIDINKKMEALSKENEIMRQQIEKYGKK